MIDMLKRLSPVPVKFICCINFSYYGRYCYTGGYEEHPCIKIAKELNDHEQLAVLAHEIGHAKCFEKNCNCVTTKNYVRREIHAFKYGLKWLLENEQKESLRWSVKMIKTFLNRYDHYTQVAEHIMKLKLWQKCLNYVNNP